MSLFIVESLAANANVSNNSAYVTHATATKNLERIKFTL